MKLKLLLFFICLFSFNSYSQEICNNAIDDDNDGLIDLNDSDCACSSTVNVPSLIPNPSFEQHTCCPYGWDQMECATTWIQATNATSDYYNCGYAISPITDLGLNNYPDGTGIVGALYLGDWKEYVGARLTAPMLAGTTYQLAFKIAGLQYNSFGQVVMPVSNYGPVNVTLYGCANGNNLPVSTFQSPNMADPTWVEIGHALYTPVSVWGDIVIQFTPAFNVNAIMIGPPPVLPPDYPIFLISPGPFEYILYDKLILNKLQFFNVSNTITSTGNFCSNNVVLHTSNTDTNFTYQWYNNGIAILNATASTLPITTFTPGSSYSLKISDGLYCVVSNSLILNTIVPAAPVVVSPVTYCKNDPVAPLSAIGSNLLWYTAATGGIGSPITPTPSSAIPGNYTFYVSQTCSGESARAVITVTINAPVIPNFPAVPPICYGINPPVLTTVSPNGVSGTWTPNTINNNQNGSYTFHAGIGVCAENQILNISVIPPVAFNLVGGCSDGEYFMAAEPESGNFDLNSLTFEWLDVMGNIIGQNEPTINVSDIINSTTEIEVFPLTYGLKIIDTNLCESYKSQTIDKIFCKIPKGISPNNDGANDFFDLRGLNVTRLEIFNRYGVKVFKQNNYTIEWKGQTDSGNDLPDGTYYYYIETEKGGPKTGWVYLNR